VAKSSRSFSAGVFPECAVSKSGERKWLSSWPVESSRLEVGEALLLHSDGLSEARNLAGEEFGDARIEAAARSGIGMSAQALADALTEQARVFRGGETPEDDVSVAVLRRLGSGL